MDQSVSDSEDFEAPRELLVFRLIGVRFAVALLHVREIAKVPHITEVPRASAMVKGVVSLRGEVMPVLSIHAQMGLPELTGPLGRFTRILVVQVPDVNGPAAILVDSVEQVIRPEKLERISGIHENDGTQTDRPKLLEPTCNDLVIEFVRDSGGRLIVLSLPRILGLVKDKKDN